MKVGYKVFFMGENRQRQGCKALLNRYLAGFLLSWLKKFPGLFQDTVHFSAGLLNVL